VCVCAWAACVGSVRGQRAWAACVGSVRGQCAWAVCVCASLVLWEVALHALLGVLLLLGLCTCPDTTTGGGVLWCGGGGAGAGACGGVGVPVVVWCPSARGCTHWHCAGATCSPSSTAWWHRWKPLLLVLAATARHNPHRHPGCQPLPVMGYSCTCMPVGICVHVHMYLQCTCTVCTVL